MKCDLRKFFGSVAVVVLAIGGLVIVYKTNAAPSVSASGHGTLLRLDENGDTVRRQFSFNAKQNSSGAVTGQAVLHNPAFDGANGHNYQAKMDISCMRTVGNIVVFGGTVRRTNDPNLLEVAFFSVQDNGEPGAGRDMLSGLVFWDDIPGPPSGDPGACAITDPFPMEPIEAGNIQVRQ